MYAKISPENLKGQAAAWNIWEYIEEEYENLPILNRI
jgi:hypothetical protein